MFSDRDYYRNSGNPLDPRNPNGFSGVTLVILANALFFLLQCIGNDFLEGLLALDAQHPLQVWRLVGYQFLHGSFTHILLNMYGVWLFGRLVEAALGKMRFLSLYLFSGILGGVFFLLANSGTSARCVGASGAEFGVMVAAAIAFPKVQFFLLFPPLPVRLWALALVYCAIEICSLGGPLDGVAHMAHLGGALGGLLYMQRLLVHSRRNTSRSRGANPFAGGRAPRRPSTPPPEQDFGDVTYDQAELDRILDKVSRQGFGQLTPREQAVLRKASQELKKRQ
jgi:membrane associated rhomboid family serine protease